MPTRSTSRFIVPLLAVVAAAVLSAGWRCDSKTIDEWLSSTFDRHYELGNEEVQLLPGDNFISRSEIEGFDNLTGKGVSRSDDLMTTWIELSGSEAEIMALRRSIAIYLRVRNATVSR